MAPQQFSYEKGDRYYVDDWADGFERQSTTGYKNCQNGNQKTNRKKHQVPTTCEKKTLTRSETPSPTAVKFVYGRHQHECYAQNGVQHLHKLV